MAKEFISIPNLKFLLHEVHKVEDLLQFPFFQDHDPESIDMMVDAAKQLADSFLFPHFVSVDRDEPELENGKVTASPAVRPMLDAMAEAGWIGASSSYEFGGMQIPEMLAACADTIFQAANNGMMGYSGLTTGAANLINTFGTQEQREAYVPHMFGGKWQGTMCLTEPQAGSSLSDVETSASPLRDGTYSIKGQKIFITCGDHDQSENIVHLVLARIDGAPAGTKGISLFIVPKHRPDGSGGLTYNDVETIGIYHKMGQKGNPAVHLQFGSNDDSRGYLVGQENNGLRYMFQMMNGARIGVGIIGAAIASAAYYASLEYANERPQGRPLGNRNLNEPQTLIINHPNVKRMLLFQKSVVEGAISLLLECARCHDLSRVTEGEESENYELLLDLLTPIAKTFPSEAGVESVSAGMQVLGGAGYCEDFPLEQLYRDIRITAIYEGTTGIQSLDLLGRKVTMKGGKAVQLLTKEIQKTMEAAATYEDLQPYVGKLKAELEQVQKVTFHLLGYAKEGQIEKFLADANLYMELFSLVTIAWQWLKQGVAAKEALVVKSPQGDERKFYASKLHTMKYFFHYELPKTTGFATRLMDPVMLTLREEEVELV